MKLEDGKYLKIEWDSNTLKVVDKKYMDRYMAKKLWADRRLWRL